MGIRLYGCRNNFLFTGIALTITNTIYDCSCKEINILLHKANVQYEVHGWSPKYFTPALKKEIGGRLQDRILFGWDWPTLTLERLTEDWRGLGYAEDVYEKIFHRNAEAFFPGAAPA